VILPSEWMPVIWGGEEPVFQTEEEMRTVLGAIMGRYNEIVVCLNTDLTTSNLYSWKDWRERSLRRIGQPGSWRSV
jgi:uncharacterized protein